MPKKIDYVRFKSRDAFFNREASGVKCNTVREFDKEDERFKRLMTGKVKRIVIDNADYPNMCFTRDITDVCFWENLYIISWKHPIFDSVSKHELLSVARKHHEKYLEEIATTKYQIDEALRWIHVKNWSSHKGARDALLIAVGKPLDYFEQEEKEKGGEMSSGKVCFCICHVNATNIDCKSCCIGVNQVRDLRRKHKGIGMKEYMKHLEHGCDCK